MHFKQCSLSQNVEESNLLLIDAQTELVTDGQLKEAEQLGHVSVNGSQLLYLRFFVTLCKLRLLQILGRKLANYKMGFKIYITFLHRL